MSIVEEPYKSDPHRWAVFGVFAAIYLLVYFHRVSTSVIATDLLAAFETHATALGLMSSMYFYAYALEQPLVGYLADRLGPRLVVGLWSLIASCGCILFGLAPTIEWAAIGRGLIGFGVGGVYIPSLKAFSQWFQKKEFGTMTGLLLSSGNLGAVIATAPLAWMAGLWGWRGAFLVIGGVTLCLALAALLFIHDYKGRDMPSKQRPGHMPERSSTSQSSVFDVLKSFRFWVLGIMFFGFLSCVTTFQGLWATPFLMTALSVDRLQASKLNLLIPLGFMFGAPFFGWLQDHIFRNKVNVLMGMMTMLIIIWIILTFETQTHGGWALSMLLFVMGGTAGGFATALWTLVRETTPGPIMGLTSGLLNPFPLMGMAIMQSWTGAILDRVGRVNGIYPTEAYRHVFLVFLITVCCCLVLCTLFRKRLQAGS